MEIALENDDERAHELLEHRNRRGTWQWQHNGRWYDAETLEAQIVRQPITLQGERFRLRCDTELSANIQALFDLERLGVWWYDTFGEDLELDEVLQPVTVVAQRDSSTGREIKKFLIFGGFLFCFVYGIQLFSFLSAC